MIIFRVLEFHLLRLSIFSSSISMVSKIGLLIFCLRWRYYLVGIWGESTKGLWVSITTIVIFGLSLHEDDRTRVCSQSNYRIFQLEAYPVADAPLIASVDFKFSSIQAQFEFQFAAQPVEAHQNTRRGHHGHRTLGTSEALRPAVYGEIFPICDCWKSCIIFLLIWIVLFESLARCELHVWSRFEFIPQLGNKSGLHEDRWRFSVSPSFKKSVLVSNNNIERSLVDLNQLSTVADC